MAAQHDTQPDRWTMLESPPEGCEATADLYSWSLNYEAGAGPFALLLDLIGWSEDELGVPVFVGGKESMMRLFGCVELAKLGAALVEFANQPHHVRSFVDALMNAEAV
jgi:hypothetical protein